MNNALVSPKVERRSNAPKYMIRFTRAYIISTLHHTIASPIVIFYTCLAAFMRGRATMQQLTFMTNAAVSKYRGRILKPMNCGSKRPEPSATDCGVS